MAELEDPDAVITILALDIAGACGVTELTPGEKPVIYTKNFGKDDVTSLDWIPRVAGKATRWIAQRTKDKTLKPITHIAIEAPITGGMRNTGAQAQAMKWVLLASLTATPYLRRTPIYWGNVKTIRKHFINNGGHVENPKPKVMRMCNDMGVWPDNFDESDSYALAHWIASELGYRHLLPDNRKHFRVYA